MTRFEIADCGSRSENTEQERPSEASFMPVTSCRRQIHVGPKSQISNPKSKIRRAGFTLIELLIVIVIIAILMALLIPTAMRILCTAREAAAGAMIKDLSTALKSYDHDYGVFPAGGPDGSTGSKNLVTRLGNLGARKLPYYPFTPDLKTAAGELMSPVREGDIIEYLFPSQFNPDTALRPRLFDLYTKDCDGLDKAINNWGQ